MAQNETKRRLLLSKWRGVADRAEVELRLGRLLRDVDQLNDLVGKLATQDEEIEKLKADLVEAREEVKSLEAEQDEATDNMAQVLTDVKYWMHRAQFRPTWPLLRRIEDVLS